MAELCNETTEENLLLGELVKVETRVAIITTVCILAQTVPNAG